MIHSLYGELEAGTAAGNELSPFVWSRNTSCAAMHIRRTDKFTEDPQAKTTGNFSLYSRMYRSWAYWNSDRPRSEPLPVLLGSEDKTTFSVMPELLRPATAYYIPGRHFVMDMKGRNKFRDIKQGNNRLAELYGLLEDEMREVKQKQGAEGLASWLADPAHLKDEGMTLVAQILMMGQCQSFFGSFSSNFGILIHDLQYSRAIATEREIYAVDANGRTYCGCGAFFCMRLEKRSIKEPLRKYENMVEAFKGDAVWNI